MCEAELFLESQAVEHVDKCLPRAAFVDKEPVRKLENLQLGGQGQLDIVRRQSRNDRV